MKTLSPALETRLGDRAVQLGMLMTITRADATVVRLTDYDRALTLGANTWLPQAGLKRSAISITGGLEVDSLDIEGYYDGPIDENSLRTGRYDGARVEIALTDAEDPDSYGLITLFVGWVGDISLHRTRFTLAASGLTEPLQQAFGEMTSPDCRANLGDARCQVNLAPWTFTGTVTAVTSPRELGVSISQAANLFAYGLCTFTGGANAGLKIEIKASTTSSIELFLPAPYTVVVGDAITLIAGCDKRFTTCASKFANGINFQGEPDLPGIAPLTEDARSLV